MAIPVSKGIDKFIARAKELGAPQWIAQQGMELSNLIESGFLQPQSIANKAQITKAKGMYTDALANKSFRNAQTAKLKSSGTVKTVKPIERPIITPESLQGSILTPVVGDTTVVGQTLDEMFGYSLDGVRVDGGPMFGLAMKDEIIDPSNPELRAAWASMADAANRKQKGIDEIAEMTQNSRVVGSYSPMTDLAMDFAAPLSEATARITQQIDGIPKSIIKQFDAAIREGSGRKVSKDGTVTYNRDPYPDWVGIESKDVVNQLTGEDGFPKKGAGALRKAYMAVSAAKGDSKRGFMNFRDYGIPNRNAIIKDITEPELQGVPKASAGFSLFDAMPNQSTIPFGDRKDNLSYDQYIIGDAKGGHEVFFPPDVYYNDLMKHLSQQVNSAGRPFNMTEQINSFMSNPTLYQRADQKWLDKVMGHQEMVLEAAKQGIKPALGAGGLFSAINSQAGEMEGQYDPTSMSGVLGITPEMIEAMAQSDALDQQRMADREQRYGQYADDQMMPREQTYSEQLGNYLSNLRYGDDSNRQQQEMARVLSGILDLTPVGSADALKLGVRQKEAGNTAEGWLNSILGASEAAIPAAGLGYKYGKKGLQGLMEKF